MPIPTRTTSAKTRIPRDADEFDGPTGPLGGPGGSSTPAIVDLRGGPPDREDEASGSNSKGNSWNSCGMFN
ncbi:MAG: hypothetical protein ACRD36_03440, partial [Candidatus Acidiferrum sp.]